MVVRVRAIPRNDVVAGKKATGLGDAVTTANGSQVLNLIPHLFGLKGMSHENQETHDVADTAGTLGRVDDSRMLAGGKLKAEKVGIVSDEYATLSDGKLELSFVRRLYKARIGGGGDFYAAES